MSKTATLVRKLDDFTGDARLYEVEPAVTYEVWSDVTDEYGPAKTRHVVVSATVAPYTGPETYIFPANAKGEIVSWAELDGSFRGSLDHDEALRNAGYHLAGPTS